MGGFIKPFLLLMLVFVISGECAEGLATADCTVNVALVQDEARAIFDKRSTWLPTEYGVYYRSDAPQDPGEDLEYLRNQKLALCRTEVDDPEPNEMTFESIPRRAYMAQCVLPPAMKGTRLLRGTVVPIVGVSQEYFLEASLEMAQFIKKTLRGQLPQNDGKRRSRRNKAKLLAGEKIEQSFAPENNGLCVTCWCAGGRPGNIGILQEAAEKEGLKLVVANCGFHGTSVLDDDKPKKLAPGVERPRSKSNIEEILERHLPCSAAAGQQRKVIFWGNCAEDQACFARFFFDLFCVKDRFSVEDSRQGYHVTAGTLFSKACKKRRRENCESNPDVTVSFAFTFTKKSVVDTGTIMAINAEVSKARLLAFLVDNDRCGVKESVLLPYWTDLIKRHFGQVYHREYLDGLRTSFPNNGSHLLVKKPRMRDLMCAILEKNRGFHTESLDELEALRPFEKVDVLLNFPGVTQGNLEGRLQCELLFHMLVKRDRHGVGCLWWGDDNFVGGYKPDTKTTQDPDKPIWNKDKLRDKAERTLLIPQALSGSFRGKQRHALERVYDRIIFVPMDSDWVDGMTLLPGVCDHIRREFVHEYALVHAQIPRSTDLHKYVIKDAGVKRSRTESPDRESSVKTRAKRPRN